MSMARTKGYRRSWPYLKTPVGIYAIVMVPICGLELFLLLTDSPGWMDVSAGAVLLLTGVCFYRGYVRRLVLGDHGARFNGLLGGIDIPWSRVRAVGTYLPDGGLGTTEYVYITTRASPPRGKWDMDRDTIQLQNRPGLLEAIDAARGTNGHGS